MDMPEEPNFLNHSKFEAEGTTGQISLLNEDEAFSRRSRGCRFPIADGKIDDRVRHRADF